MPLKSLILMSSLFFTLAAFASETHTCVSRGGRPNEFKYTQPGSTFGEISEATFRYENDFFSYKAPESDPSGRAGNLIVAPHLARLAFPLHGPVVHVYEDVRFVDVYDSTENYLTTLECQ